MEEKKICPYCGEEILAVAKKCKHCGEWLDKEPANETQEPAIISSKEQTKVTEVESQTKMSEEDREYFDRGFIPFYSERIWKLYRFKSEGSVSRGEYWKFALITGLTMLFVMCLFSALVEFYIYIGAGESALASHKVTTFFSCIILLLVTYTCTCMVIRRLHDTGKSGWLSILGFIPVVNIILLVFLCQKGEAVDPKAKLTTKDTVSLVVLAVLILLMWAVSQSLYVENVKNGFGDEDEIAAMQARVSSNDSVDKSSWMNTGYGFRIPSDFQRQECPDIDIIEGAVWSTYNMEVCYWELGSWATVVYPDAGHVVGSVEQIATVASYGDTGIYSGTTDYGREFLMKIINDNHSVHVLSVIYDEELEEEDITTLGGLTNEVRDWDL